MKKPTVIWLLACLAPLCLKAEDVTTEPIGFNKVTCLPNSDTIVGVPLRTQGSKRAALSAPPSVAGDSATISLGTAFLTPEELTGHYLKFIDGNRAGRWYDIQTAANSGTANTTSAVTISLNGDTLGTATTGDKVLIARYWTLDELFPPAGATTSWSGDPPVPNGHAIVASTSPLTIKSEVLLPNLIGTGINLSSAASYFITGSAWKKFGALTEPGVGATVLYPDNYFTIRHKATVTSPTVFRIIGEVELQSMSIPLTFHGSGKQDNFIGLPRPVDVSLGDLGFDETTFLNSASSLAIKDSLLVFDNSLPGRNKSAAATYYRLTNNQWRKFGDASTDQSIISKIPAGSGFIIRKAASGAGGTSMWQNTPPY